MTNQIINIAKTGAKVINLGPTVTHALATQAGIDQKYATAAYIAATVADYAVPGIPVGSVIGIAGFGALVIYNRFRKTEVKDAA